MDGETITLTREDFEELIDARDHAAAMREIATGAMQTLSSAEADAYLTAPTPLTFWRKHRGFTQAALAGQVGIAQPSMAQAEAGRQGLRVGVWARLAKVLATRIEDLLPREN